MRNLKRVLSLSLASVMLLGMMVIGSSAASDYNDVDYDNVEAIEVLQAINVMSGDLDNDGNLAGTFRPGDEVKRSEVARIMAFLMDLDYDYYIGANPFADMVGHWAEKYAAACYANGIISGRTTTAPLIYDPDATVGDAQVTFGSSNYVYRVSRNDAIGNAINTDKADKGNSVDGLEGPILDLGEQLYQGKLRLNKDEVDPFGRPARMWEFDGAEIGTYAKVELLATDPYSVKVTGKMLYDLLGATALKDYATYVYIDGVWTDDTGAKTALGSAYFNATDMNKNNKDKVGGTGTGTLTQVYVDHDKDIIYVAVINTYLAIADNDYDTKKEEAAITAYAIKKDTATLNGEYIKVKQPTAEDEPFKLAVEDFPSIVDIKKDDPLLITVAEGEVQTIQPAPVLEAVTITTFAKKSSVVSDGATYKYTTTAGYKWDDDINTDYTTSGITNLKERTYNIYLDNYDNLIGIKEVEAKNNYVFITGIDLNDSNRLNQNADASAIFLDGTMKSIKINMGKSEWNTPPSPGTSTTNALMNTWCTYTVSGDVYTVTEVKDTGITSGDVPGPDGGSYGESNDAESVPGGDNNEKGKLAQFNQKSDDADFYVGAKHYRLYGGGASGARYFNVYADKDSIFLTAKLGNLQKGSADGDNYGIIKGVVSVSTGIENTDLIVWQDDNAEAQANKENTKIAEVGLVEDGQTSSGVYGLYNKDGLIIAAVVVGEDAGSSKNFVFVSSSDIKDETYNGESDARAVGDGLWTWTREVISNGEKILLSEVGEDYKSVLKDLNKYEWWQIGTNADGNVTTTTSAKEAAEGNSSIEYTEDFQEIKDKIETSIWRITW